MQACHPTLPHPFPPAACPPKGFTAHVLGYTINAVIEAVAQVGQPGCLDDSLLMILPLMEVGGRAGGWKPRVGEQTLGGMMLQPVGRWGAAFVPEAVAPSGAGKEAQDV